MDTVMEEKRGTYTALSLSLALHVILLLAAGALGLFSIAVPQTGDTPVEVTLYDAGSPATYTGMAGSSGGDTAVTGTKGGTSGTSGGGDAAPAAPPAPPAERVEASLRAEATPEYPQELIEDDVEGSVTVKILVAADGSVESVRLVTSSGYSAMDRAAIAAGDRFQFNPGDNGRRGVWTKTFRFQLD